MDRSAIDHDESSPPLAPAPASITRAEESEEEMQGILLSSSNCHRPGNPLASSTTSSSEDSSEPSSPATSPAIRFAPLPTGKRQSYATPATGPNVYIGGNPLHPRWGYSIEEREQEEETAEEERSIAWKLPKEGLAFGKKKGVRMKRTSTNSSAASYESGSSVSTMLRTMSMPSFSKWTPSIFKRRSPSSSPSTETSPLHSPTTERGSFDTSVKIHKPASGSNGDPWSKGHRSRISFDLLVNGNSSRSRADRGRRKSIS